MSTNRALAIVLVLAFLLLGVRAELSAADEIPWYQDVTVRGFVSSSFTYNLNTPEGARNDLRIFDGDHNSFTLDVAQLSVQSLPEDRGETGFRFDLVAGSVIPPVMALDPGRQVDLHQGFASWIAPVGRGLRVDAGKFYTHLGYELVEGVDGWNEQHSRSFLFGYAIPGLHVGVKGTLPLSDGYSVMAGVVNGWDNPVENNRSKSLIAQLSAAPLEGLAVAANAIYGPELASNDGVNRWVLDLTGSYALTPKVRLGANFDLGQEEAVTPVPMPETKDATAKAGEDDEVGDDTSDWLGAAAYLRLELSPKVALNLRGEFFDDQDGYRTGLGMPVTLTEFTVTPEYRLSDRMTVRGEFRLDRADEKIFTRTSNRETDLRKTQPTIGLNWVYAF